MSDLTKIKPEDVDKISEIAVRFSDGTHIILSHHIPKEIHPDFSDLPNPNTLLKTFLKETIGKSLIKSLIG